MKINIKNIDKLAKALNEVTGKASAHVHSVRDIISESESAYKMLNRYLSKKDIVGSKLVLDSFPNLPNSYGKHNVICTIVKLEIYASGIFVTDISRNETYASSHAGPSHTWNLQNDTKDKLAKSFFQSLNVA